MEELSYSYIQKMYGIIEELDDSTLIDFVYEYHLLYEEFGDRVDENIIKDLIEVLKMKSLDKEQQVSETGIRLPAGLSQRSRVPYELGKICETYVAKFKQEIWPKILGKENISEFAVDVIQIVAPAIAQEYSGIPAMAITAVITIMCRKGITLYLIDKSRI